MSFPGWRRERPKRGCRGREKILQDTVQLSSPFPNFKIINFRKIFEYYFQNSGWPCWETVQSVDVHREAFSLQASSNCLSLVFHCSIFRIKNRWLCPLNTCFGLRAVMCLWCDVNLLAQLQNHQLRWKLIGQGRCNPASLCQGHPLEDFLECGGVDRKRGGGSFSSCLAYHCQETRKSARCRDWWAFIEAEIWGP